MLVFTDPTVEAQYRAWYNQQRLFPDGIVLFASWPIHLMGLVTLWRFDHTRPSSWLATVTILSVAVRVVPPFLLYRHPHCYARHRCFIMVCQRVADMISSLAALLIFQEGLGAADQQDFLHSLQSLFHGEGLVAGIYSCLVFPMPSAGWSMACQVLHLACIFTLHGTFVHHMENSLQHLRPYLKQWWPGVVCWSDRNLLLILYAVLEVGLGLLLVSCILYANQLQQRRRYRKQCLQSLGYPTGFDGPQPVAAPQAAKRQGPWSRNGQRAVPACQTKVPGLSIIPVWKLFMPQAVVVLLTASAAGRGVDVLRYMI